MATNSDGFGVESSSGMKSDNSSGNTNSIESMASSSIRCSKTMLLLPSGNTGREESSETEPSRHPCLDFEKVSYVEDLKFNLLSGFQICDKKQAISSSLTMSVISYLPKIYTLWRNKCLVAKQQSMKLSYGTEKDWGKINFKNITSRVKCNLVEFTFQDIQLEHSCLACRKVKQHRGICKNIEAKEHSVEPLE
ncbi:hypothetical protein Tco_0628935 [Tanacetum coccineum]|uniref:Uncharacterized protein n=1 Tax=Tanacetum coccineum TaxID=301880 RepID=A0ABQ4WRS0_9ASTR